MKGLDMNHPSLNAQFVVNISQQNNCLKITWGFTLTSDPSNVTSAIWTSHINKEREYMKSEYTSMWRQKITCAHQNNSGTKKALWITLLKNRKYKLQFFLKSFSIQLDLLTVPFFHTMVLGIYFVKYAKCLFEWMIIRIDCCCFHCCSKFTPRRSPKGHFTYLQSKTIQNHEQCILCELCEKQTR